MAVIIGDTSSPYDYQPYNNNPAASQTIVTEWQLSPAASIAVLVCLPVTAMLFLLIGVLIGIDHEKRRVRAAAKNKRGNDGGNQNGGRGQEGLGGVVVPLAPPANADGNLPGIAGHVGSAGQVGNPIHFGVQGQAASAA